MSKTEIVTRNQFKKLTEHAIFRAYDGNEYAIVPVAEDTFVSYAFTVMRDNKLELIEAKIHDSYREALHRIVEMTILDN